jgi:hypothetical protein
MTHQHLQRRILLPILAASIGMVVLGSVTNAQAQAGMRAEDHAKTVELTLFAGASIAPRSEGSATSLQVKTGVPAGGRIAYNFDQHSAVEFTVANPLSVYGNYVYNFSTSRAKLVPYLTAGLGAGRYGMELGDAAGTSNTNTNESGLDRRQTAFTTNFGGGVKYFVTDKVGLRFDARDIVGCYKATFTNVAGVAGGIVQGRRTLNDAQLTVGVVFSIGRR